MNNKHKSNTSDTSQFRPRSLSPMIGFTSRTPISENPISTEVLNHAYILPKFANAELSVPQTAPNQRKLSEDNKPALLNKIALLEKLHRADLIRIEQLENQVKELYLQVITMKDMNKDLLADKGFGGGDVHALYQDLFITDMKQQMTDLNNDASKFRSQREQMKKEFDQIKKENGQLQATLKRYRLMLSSALKKNHNALESAGDASSAFSGFMSETDKNTNKLSENYKKRLSYDITPPHSLKTNALSLNKIEKLNLVLISFVK